MSGAETLGIVGSIIAIVQISKTIISICHLYIDGVEGAPSDLRVILIEVSALKGIAKSLQYLTRPNIATSNLLNQLVGVMGPIDGCKKALKELEALFPPAAFSLDGQTRKIRNFNTTLSLLAWPRKSGKAKKLLQEIIQYKTTINLALTAEFVHDLKEVKAKTDQIQDFLTEAERDKIYSWLETTNPSGIHNRSQKLYEHGTGSWVQRTPEWPLWIDGSHRCLWIHGIPGAGKSILASYIAEKIEEYCNSVSTATSKFGRVYYYCYFGHNQDESSHFLGWLIGQLCRQSGKLSQELHDTYKSGKAPSLASLLSILDKIIQRFNRVYVVLDAVDESMPREDLLAVIQDLSTAPRFSRLSLLVTSRRYRDIEHVMGNCSIPISMSNSFIEDDIRSFVRSKVHSDAKYKQWPKDLLEEMEKTIPRKAEGMFRWAVCQLDILKRLKPEVSTIKAALSNLPKTLDETYDRIFLAIPEDDWLSVQHVFHWLAYHNDLFGRNMDLNTLLQAVQTSTMGLLGPDADQLYDFEGLRECCGCLIIVEEEGLKARYSSREIYTMATTVSFAHYTVKEYLQSPRISKKPAGFFSLSEERIKKTFAEIAFQQALAIQPGSMEDYRKKDDYKTLYNLLTSDFKHYCGVASALQLNVWPESVSSEPSFIEHSEALVNPRRPSFIDLQNLLSKAYWIVDLTDSPTFHEEFQFWSIDWEKEPEPASAIFMSFLLTAALDDICHLALAFTHKHSMLAILTQQLHFSKDIWDVLEYDDVDTYEFKGTIPQITAQLAFRQPAGFSLILDLISDLGVAHFDLSTLLLFYMFSHQRHGHQELDIIERLLRLGADSNGPEGAFVTPLQIAAKCWDLDGVERLLSAGADPNGSGGTDSAWELQSFMGRKCSDFNGASPLFIIRNSSCLFFDSMMEELGIDEMTCEKVETRLLESGAVEIRPDSWDSLIVVKEVATDSE